MIANITGRHCACSFFCVCDVAQRGERDVDETLLHDCCGSKERKRETETEGWNAPDAGSCPEESDRCTVGYYRHPRVLRAIEWRRGRTWKGIPHRRAQSWGKTDNAERAELALLRRPRGEDERENVFIICEADGRKDTATCIL